MPFVECAEKYFPSAVKELKTARKQIQEIDRLKNELERYKTWVQDLQSGMYVNCVYCGHRYGPADKVPVSMADALKQHIEQCPEHPMSKLRAELEAERQRVRWIPVAERLPKEYTMVLIFDGNNIFRAECVEGEWHGIPDDTGFIPDSISHWMPLPVSPKGVEWNG